MLSQPAVHALSMTIEDYHAFESYEEQLGHSHLHPYRANQKVDRIFLDSELISCPVSGLSLVMIYIAIGYILAM